MKVGTVLLAILVAGACIGSIVWMAGGTPSMEFADPNPTTEVNALEISKTGPWPKAVVPEPYHNFGVMAAGSTKSQKFIVKNEGKPGDPVLKLKIKGTSCTCTVSELTKDEIPPGEEGEIELKWTPKDSYEDFSKYAEIYTNDPKNDILHLSISGRVEELLTITPKGVLRFEGIERERIDSRTLTVHSAVLDKFAIESVEPSNKSVTATVEPLPQEELDRLRSKSGYQITVALDPKQLKPGAIREKILLKTDIEEAKEIPIAISGSFLSSIRGMPYHPDGVDTSSMSWLPELLNTNLGNVDAKKGGQGWFKLIVADMPDGQEFEVKDIESSLEFVTASVEKLESPPDSTRQLALVTFQIKPGAPVGAYTRKDSAKVVLKTNHPLNPEIKFYVEFTAI